MCYNKKSIFLNSKEKLKKINLNLLPNYIRENKSKFKNILIKFNSKRFFYMVCKKIF